MLKKLKQAPQSSGLGAFAAAILSPDAPTPSGIVNPGGEAATKRFNVYRNNVIVSLIEALKARYPVVCKLVGDKFFQAMAREYVLAHPPSSPVLIEYGQTFPEFIAHFPPAASVSYLGDVARLENAYLIAYHACDAVSLNSSRLQELSPEVMETLRFTLHPSVSFINSAYAIVSIWQTNRKNEPLKVAADTTEAVLVCRAELKVEVQSLAGGAYAFLQACKMVGG